MILNELRIMRGPNMWSADHRKLIVVKLDLSGSSDTEIQTISDHIKRNYNVKVSASEEKDKYKELAGLINDLIVEVQPGSASLYNKTEFFGSSYYLISEYDVEEVGKEAAYSVLDMVDAILKGDKPAPISDLKKELERILQRYHAGPSTSTIISAAQERNIPVIRTTGGYFMFGYGKYQKRIAASIAETTGYIGVDIACDKDITKRVLDEACIPVPKGALVRKEASLNEVAEEIGFPLVVKPWDGNQGKGVTGNINDMAALQKAYALAEAYSNPVIVEKYITGTDHRFLVVNYKFIAAAKRIPACVIGNGSSTIQELIDEVNTDPARGDGHQNSMTKIKVDEFTLNLLERKKLSLQSVVEKGECVYLKDTANLSTGGTAEDVTDEVHEENIRLAERIARIIGLDICGIDIMAPDVSTPITKNGGAILEVNAAPGLRMHIAPIKGKPRDVGNAIIDLMFPDKNKIRIPIVAVTGTNGKTTTSRLMAYVARQKFNVGLTTTDGIYLNGDLLCEGDCTGPKSSGLILREPGIDFAVLECARGGIIRSGLAFDECDIAIVTNIAEDHIGLKDINTLEDLARVKVVVPRSVKADGYAILNAADDLVYKMKDQINCKIGLFSLDKNNERFTEHCKNGGYGVTVSENNEIVILKGNDTEIVVTNIEKIPLTLDGKADFMVENVLPVVLASYLLDFDMEKVKDALHRFNPSTDKTPGRLNMFAVNGVNVIVDYAHNPHGLKAVGRYLSHLDKPKTGIVTGVGDRRDIDIVEVGKIAAEIYDKVIIRIDEDTRGRTAEEISDLITEGINKIDRNKPYYSIPDTRNALKFALENSEKDSYVIISADNIPETINIMKELENELTDK
jgi:cyanophycin synthetase